MQVRDGLAAMTAIVDGDSEPLDEFEFFGDLRCDQKEMPQRGLIPARRFSDARNRFFWNNEAMNRCLWINVVNNNAVLVLVFNFCGDFAGDDLLKKGGFAHGLISNLDDDDLQV